MSADVRLRRSSPTPMRLRPRIRQLLSATFQIGRIRLRIGRIRVVSFKSAQQSFNNQSDNQSAIAQPAAHNTTAAHTIMIHSAHKRHAISMRNSTQTAIVYTYNRPAHNQDKLTINICSSTHLDRRGCRGHPTMRHTFPSFCVHTIEWNSHRLTDYVDSQLLLSHERIGHVATKLPPSLLNERREGALSNFHYSCYFALGDFLALDFAFDSRCTF